MKNKKSVRGKVGVAKGFGPRHAFNAAEGIEAVPEELPTPPDKVPDRGDKLMRMLLDQVVDPDTRAEIAQNPTGAKALATYASLGIMLMPEHGGQRLGEMGPSAVPHEVWQTWKPVKSDKVAGINAGGVEMVNPFRVDEAGNHYEAIGSHVVNDEGTGERATHVIVKQVEAPGPSKLKTWDDYAASVKPVKSTPDEQFPSLDAPPYDALKEPSEPPLSGQNWLDAYMKKLDEAGMVKPSAQQLQDALDALKEPPAKEKNSMPPSEEEPPFEPNVPRYRKGAKKVGVAKGFGPRHAENSAEGNTVQAVQGNTDTVPAMLTPREAVLNRNAAELAGRGNIEQLNQEGNQLAKKGVDLAAGGESDVGLSEILKTYQAGGDLTPAEIARVIAVLRGGTGGEPEPSAATQVPKYGEYHEDRPELQNPNRAKGVASVAVVKPPKAVTDNLLKYVLPGAIRREATAAIPKGVQKGASDMKSKPKQSKPAGYAGGSPYAQGYQKLQGGGEVPFKPAGAGQSQDINPNVLAGQDLKQGQLNYWNRYGQLPPGLGGGPPPSMGGGQSPYGNVHDPAPYTGDQPPPLPQGEGSTDPYAGGLTPYGGGGAYENLNQAGKKAWNPGGGGFYPPGMGFASGTQDVPGGIGAPNTSTAYSKDQVVDYKAPDLSGFLKSIQEEAQKRGISQGQMVQIAQQISGMAGGGGGSPGGGSLPYDALGGQYASFTGGTPGGYQGGISDIGYPPMLMPNAEYHADKGSTWEGPYDPNYLVQRYAGGTSQVPGYQRGGDIDFNDINSKWEGVPGDLGFNTGLTGFGRPSTMAWAGSNTRALDPWGGRFGFGGFGNMPPAGTPGFSQGPTLHPTTFDPQGYPYAQPVNADTNLVGRTRGIPRKTTS